MERRRSIVRRIGAVGVLLTVVGGGLFASAVSASASSAATITFTPGPSTGYTTGQLIDVNGSGFTPKAQVYIFECSAAPNQPTISVLGQSLPVSCTQPIGAGKATSTGTFKQPLPMAVLTGVTGPPATGTDSAQNSATADAVNYPCPQYANQTGGCDFIAFDSKGVMATPVPFTFDPSVPIPTTTTTLPGPVPCTKAADTVTSDGATVTVSQATCLTGGTTVVVSGSGFTPGATGAITECNSADGQPTVSLAGDDIDVGCSDPVSHVVTISKPGGTFSSIFSVVAGTVGPPLSGVDSAGGQASADAAKYPCPSNTTTGAGCTIGFGDSPTQAVVVPITFVPGNPGVTTSSANSSSKTSGVVTKATSSKTKASSQSLAFTGTGTGLRWMGAGGLALLVLGLMMLALADAPRRILRKLSRQPSHRS
jgi:hypothetical protein